MNEETPTQTRPKMGAFWCLVLMTGMFGLFAYFVSQQDWVCGIVVLATGFAGFGGFRAGAVKIVALLAAAAAALYFAPALGLRFETTFSNWVGTSGLTNRFLTIGAMGLLIFLIASLVLTALGRRQLDGRKRLLAANHWPGFGIGAVEGLLVMLILFGGMITIQRVNAERITQRIPPTGRAKFMAEILDITQDQIHASRLGPVIERLNPFENIEQLSKVDEVQRGLEVLMNPAQVHALLQQPAIRGLGNRADVKEALAQLKEDPEIKHLLNSDKPANKKLALRLLDHPAVLQLLDQPDFRSEAMAAIRTTIMPQAQP